MKLFHYWEWHQVVGKYLHWHCPKIWIQEYYILFHSQQRTYEGELIKDLEISSEQPTTSVMDARGDIHIGLAYNWKETDIVIHLWPIKFPLQMMLFNDESHVNL